jgi:hypothetical protein
MRQFFKHFGSKARLAKELPPPRFKTIIEPFAGSAAYSVQHATPAHDVLLFDTDERVCIVWDYLIHASAADIMRLPVDHFLAGGDIRDLNLPRAEYLLLRRWLGITGTDKNKLAPCMLNRGDTGDSWGTVARGRIACQVDQIRHWKIKQEPYDRAPDIEAHWHIDPPYQSNRIGFSTYKCAAPDYVKLGAWCRSRSGDITVHEQHGATWLPFETLSSKHGTSRCEDGERVTAHEVYWTNERRDRTGTLALFAGSEGAP